MSYSLTYTVRKALHAPELQGLWNGAAWSHAAALPIDRFLPVSVGFRPVVQAKMLHADRHLHVLFRVDDRFVRTITTDYMGPVYKDACVELFIQPKPGKGYFNFEMNSGGAMLISYIEDPTRLPQGFAKYTKVPWDLAKDIAVYHSLPKTVEPENPSPVTWVVEYALPLALMEHYVGSVGDLSGQEWRGNLYKCAEHNSQPHWASWAPLGPEVNFHVPQYFAPIRFE
ncbi:MAG: hypothetical protein AMXMBFR84_45640 [Candidatus Hydrogenedentota bacterium]